MNLYELLQGFFVIFGAVLLMELTLLLKNRLKNRILKKNAKKVLTLKKRRYIINELSRGGVEESGRSVARKKAVDKRLWM